jgi:mRNA interferase HigB
MGTSDLRIISRKAIREFGRKHSDAVAALNVWALLVKNADWRTFADVRETFKDADLVGDKVVFNIAGNRYRLIAWVACRAHKLLIKAILTHREYDMGGWKQT